MKKIVFVDRDGTIIWEPPDKQIDSLEKLEFIPGIIRGLRLLVDAGFDLVMVTNQDGLGTKGYPQKAYDLVQGKILRLLKGEGIVFSKLLVCPHFAEENCECRKPKTGLLKAYLKRNKIDKVGSFVFGDRETDVQLARNLGVRAMLLVESSWRAGTPAPQAMGIDFVTDDAYEACRHMVRTSRAATVSRKTKETDVTATVVLEGRGEHDVSTGIKFFDHMLSQLSRHSMVDIRLNAAGDIDVDAHHTVEDVGIVLGEAFRKALGNKRGIERFGFAAPLDEALAEVALDISGRSRLSFQCEFRRESVGDLPSELVEDFFKAFADGLGAGIHIRCRGRNDHHKIEAIFKTTARALKQAISVDQRAISVLPSTKGAL